MPMLKRADAEIHYEVHGAGFPVPLYAPGGLKSEANIWRGSSRAYPNGFPWLDPVSPMNHLGFRKFRGVPGVVVVAQADRPAS